LGAISLSISSKAIPSDGDVEASGKKIDIISGVAERDWNSSDFEFLGGPRLAKGCCLCWNVERNSVRGGCDCGGGSVCHLIVIDAKVLVGKDVAWHIRSLNSTSWSSKIESCNSTWKAHSGDLNPKGVKGDGCGTF